VNGRAAGVAAVGLTVLLVGAGAASADQGVALSVGRLDIVQKLTPGGGYALPPIGVRNPGDAVTSYRIVVSRMAGEPGKAVPATWFRFEPRTFTVKPGATVPVRARLSLPSGADPGHYETLVAAQIVTKGSGAQVGAAAAAKVTFSVESSSLLGGWWYSARTFAVDHQPWTWLVPAFAALALLGWFLASRFSFAVQRRR